MPITKESIDNHLRTGLLVVFELTSEQMKEILNKEKILTKGYKKSNRKPMSRTIKSLRKRLPNKIREEQAQKHWFSVMKEDV